MEEDKGEFQNVVKLGFDGFFTDVSSEMVFSISPVFILHARLLRARGRFPSPCII